MKGGTKKIEILEIKLLLIGIFFVNSIEENFNFKPN